MSLVFLANEYLKYHHPKTSLLAITIDHKARLESTEEANDINKYISSKNILHHVEQLTWTSDELRASKTTFELLARKRRYQALDKVCRQNDIHNLLVAHNLDDQLETFFYRLINGSSFYGLCGMNSTSFMPLQPTSPNQQNIQLLRPLLGFRKNRLISTCLKNNVKWFEDSTNLDHTMTPRNSIRKLLLDYNNLPKAFQPDNLTRFYFRLQDKRKKIQEQVENLDSMLEKYKTFDKGKASIELKNIPSSIIKNQSIIILARYFYQLINPISPLSSFHFRFGDFIKITKKLRDITTSSKFTMFGVEWIIQADENNTTIKMQRQKFARDENPTLIFELLNHEWTTWKLWDNRFWIRVKNDHRVFSSISVIKYIPEHHKCKIKQIQRNNGNNSSIPSYKELSGLPLIIGKTKDPENDIVFGFPTYKPFSFHGNIEVEYELNALPV